MQVTVTTNSGSIYVFMEKDGEKRVIRNYLEEGILAKPVTIKPGASLEVSFYQLSGYDYHQSSDITTYRSTPVAKIEIA